MWIVRGVPDPHYNPTNLARSIYRFDPTNFGIWEVAQLPQTIDGIPAPAGRYSAVYDRQIQRVVIFGGSVTCIDNGPPAPGCPAPYTWHHDTIFRFNPLTYSVTLDPCLRLPSVRRDTSAVWRDVDDASLVFGGAVGTWYWGTSPYGGPWTWVGEVVHYVG